jgi:hypothetical protein
MFYKFSYTGTKEKWGYGLPNTENIQYITNFTFALRPDGVLSEVENSTVSIVALTDEEIASLREENNLPADWTPQTKEQFLAGE